MTTSVNLKLSKKLFRSFLRWNRRSHILQTKFSIDMNGIGLSQYLPDNYNPIVSNKEGIQGAIFHCFRNLPKGQVRENIDQKYIIQQNDLGFKVLRDLNNVSNQLLINFEARKKRLEVEEQALSKDSKIILKFRIGQIVQHDKFKIRGIIIGWTYDHKNNIQVVEVLADTVDITPNPIAAYFRSTASSKVVLNSSNLSLVHDNALKRITNFNIKDYFDGYDSLTNRYIPNEDLAYWYENDLSMLHNQHNNHTMKDNTSIEMMKESQLLNQSLLNVGNTVLSLSKKLQNIVHKHLHSNTTTILSTTDKDKSIIRNNDKTQIQREESLSDVRIYMQYITNNILADVNKSINECNAAAFYAMDSLTNIRKAPNHDKLTFYQELRQGGLITNNINNTLVKSKLNDYKLQHNQRDVLLQFNAQEIEQIYFSIGYLGNCFNAIEQLLQFRFQTFGLAYHDGLKLSESDDVQSKIISDQPLIASSNDDDVAIATDTTSTTSIINNTNACRYDIMEIPSTNKLINKWSKECKSPEAIYNVGQVIQHKLFGYRGVICRFDQRPSIDMSKWEGIIGLEYGQEQPIYEVIPDENDVEDLFGKC